MGNRRVFVKGKLPNHDLQAVVVYSWTTPWPKQTHKVEVVFGGFVVPFLVVEEIRRENLLRLVGNSPLFTGF